VPAKLGDEDNLEDEEIDEADLRLDTVSDQSIESCKASSEKCISILDLPKSRKYWIKR